MAGGKGKRRLEKNKRREEKEKKNTKGCGMRGRRQ